MKTNHQRDFVARRDAMRWNAGDTTVKLADGTTATTFWGDPTYDGHQGAARKKKSAMRYLHSLQRLADKKHIRAALEQVEADIDEDWKEKAI